MLGKLIKYDIHSTWRDFAGVYLSIILGVIIVPQIFNYFKSETVNLLAVFIGVAIVITTIVVMIIMLFRIFNTNVFSKEGYLTMTLPVSSTQIVISKLLVSTMWIVLTGIVSAIGILIFTLSLRSIPPAQIMESIGAFLGLLSGDRVLTVVLLIFMVIVSAVKEIAKLFLACSIAHLKQLGRARVFVGILAYFVMSWVETLLLQVVGFFARLLPIFPEIESQIMLLGDLSNYDQYLGLFNAAIGLSILFGVFLTALYSVGVIGMLNRKLDLD